MKIKSLVSFLALFLCSFAAGAVDVRAAGAAAGSYQFSFEDGYAKYLEFDAQTQADGSTVGQMYLTDEATLVYGDVDGAGDPSAKYAGYYIKADFDNIFVDKNKAVMSGTIRDSNVRELIGRRVLLTVEDNGDNSRIPDRLTWGVYDQLTRDWTPADAEVKEDNGASLKWIATDAERKDDEGIPMPRDESITTSSFPVSSYSFVKVASATGDIRVQP
jgi:hypothetical protein